jgi:methyl-accepting chemotaxis protein
MGIAFSASMFGLVGSIVLGFQMVVVRKCATDFVEVVRREVLSMAEASKVNKEVEITERFLASLLADVLEQHRAADAGLQRVASRIEALVPEVHGSAKASTQLAERVASQEAVLERTAAAVGALGTAVPAMARLADSTGGVLEHSRAAQERLDRMLEHLPRQEELMVRLDDALGRVDALGNRLEQVAASADDLRDEVRGQSAALKRMDGTLWNLEQERLRQALATPSKGA